MCDWRDLKMYAWGSDLDSPQLLWSRYDENGNLTQSKDPANKNDITEEIQEVNKGKLKSDS